MNAPSFPKLPPVSWISVSQHAKPLAVRVSFIMFPSGYIGNWDKMSVRGCDRVHIRVQDDRVARRHQRLSGGAPSRRRPCLGGAPRLARHRPQRTRVTVRLPQSADLANPGKAPSDGGESAPDCRRLGSIPRRPCISCFTSRAFLRARPCCYRHVYPMRPAVAAWCRSGRKALSHAVERQTSLQYPY
jgi:hypothetical protein